MCVCVCARERVHACVSACVRACMSVCLHACVYTHACTCVQTCKCIQVHIAVRVSWVFALCVCVVGAHACITFLLGQILHVFVDTRKVRHQRRIRM